MRFSIDLWGIPLENALGSFDLGTDQHQQEEEGAELALPSGDFSSPIGNVRVSYSHTMKLRERIEDPIASLT